MVVVVYSAVVAVRLVRPGGQASRTRQVCVVYLFVVAVVLAFRLLAWCVAVCVVALLYCGIIGFHGEGRRW